MLFFRQYNTGKVHIIKDQIDNTTCCDDVYDPSEGDIRYNFSEGVTCKSCLRNYIQSMKEKISLYENRLEQLRFQKGNEYGK